MNRRYRRRCEDAEERDGDERQNAKTEGRLAASPLLTSRKLGEAEIGKRGNPPDVLNGHHTPREAYMAWKNEAAA